MKMITRLNSKAKALCSLLGLILLALSYQPPMGLYALGVEEERFLAENEHVDKIIDSVFSETDLFFTRQRLASFESGYFFLRESRDKTGTVDFMSSFDIPGNRLNIRYKNDKKELVSLDLSKGGKAPVSSELYLETDLCHMYLGQANQLVEVGEGLYEKQEVLPIEITKKDDSSYHIKLKFKANQGAKNLTWGLISKKRLLDFNSEIMRYLFENYDLQKNALLSYDGYMYVFEGNTGKANNNTYFLIPAPYLASSFVKSGGSKLGDIMGQILLKLAVRNINSDGYFPVVPKSNWLAKDYGIGSSYFDNRWNADLAITLMKSVSKQEDAELRIAYEILLNYFVKHIEQNSEQTPNDGLLNYDYGYPGQKIATHISLNHQLNLINMLFQAYMQEKDEIYLNYAKKLIKGVEYIGSGWVKEDGELHYAYLTDGTLGLKDYDLLTYNDALITRRYMEGFRETKSDVLIKIMEKKLEWIKNKGLGHLYE